MSETWQERVHRLSGWASLLGMSVDRNNQQPYGWHLKNHGRIVRAGSLDQIEQWLFDNDPGVRIVPDPEGR
ncbi:hypothetical protein ACIGO9_28690 [Nocardia asteroides]|uniref:hypothetical protein n=1 Tax=Nocardia asteroides TaxID=1824 RepID=UPI0037CB1575